MAAQLPSNVIEKSIEEKLVQVTKVIEEQIDSELNRLDNLEEDEIESIRRKRMQEMKAQAKEREEWIANGHGVYSELPDERAFFDACNKSPSGLLCHFYRDSTFRCKIFDKHLTTLAPKHLECRMVKLNVEKSPFLTQRLDVRIIPTILIMKDGKLIDRIIGFEDLGMKDDFSVEMLEWRLAVGTVINYAGDINCPPDSKAKRSFAGQSTKNVKSIRESSQKYEDDDDDDDNDDW
ncbi:unnamed protein product [Protopolystoma xenopodis]|uniref:Thioredoxin domain-containing protein 9 n=1 Tax=Protopolystoma xenopodis TaxID=117903 RepID=A0A3S5B083_9PLAT|nr:unnamed protein product [Protopolystoma xenopodis]